MRPFLPIVLQPGMQKKGSAINGVGLFLSYVLPCTTGLTVNHRPTTTLSTISRPRNIARNFGGRSENRLYIGKASIAILRTISLLFAVSNVAVFSTGPAKHRLLSTFNPLETFTRNKNGQKNQEKKKGETNIVVQYVPSYFHPNSGDSKQKCQDGTAFFRQPP